MTPAPTQNASQNEGVSPAPVETLLIVDDEAPIREALGTGLRALGFVVQQAANATEALEHLARDPGIGAIITDIRMPGRSGLELLAELARTRGDERALEAIIISGHGTLEHAADAMRHGAVDFLPKPFTLQQVAEAGRRAMERAQARRRTAADRQELNRALAAARAEAQASAAHLAHVLESKPAPAEDSAAQALDRARMLSHELRTPLVPVLGFGELLRDVPLSPETVREYGREITEGANRLLVTINRLLEAERLAAPGLQASMQPEPASLIAQAVSAAVQGVAAARQVVVKLYLLPDLRLPCDRALLQTALVELLNNAVLHSPSGGTVSLTLARNGQECRAEVRDHGPGWPAAVLAAPGGSTGESILTRQRDGLGLGLVMARRIAEVHHGALLLVSPPDGGSLAVLRWPAP